MSSQLPKAEFSDVDRASDPQSYIACLDYQHTTAFNQTYKRRALELLELEPGMRALDVGCGTGEDALAMARLVAPDGVVVGLDSSQTMIQEALRRGVTAGLPATFIQGDACALPFDDGAFDRAHADKTFHHLPDPMRALAELARVATPGGYLVIVEPDHESRVMDSLYSDITRRFFHFRNSTFQQPGIDHRLYALCKDVGLEPVAVEAMTQITTEYAEIRPMARFEGGIHLAQEQGVVTQAEANQWLAALLEADRAGRFFHAMTYLITLARKPG